MKKENIYIWSLWILVFIIFTSCENELEIDPRQSIDGEIALSTEQNIEALLLGVYDETGQNDSYGGRIQLAADLLGTTDQVNWNGTFLDPRQFISKSILVDNVFVSNHWANAYESINQANLILDNIAVVTSNEANKNRVEGEAKFLRALNYFDLVRFWGVPYQAGMNNDQPGVPLRLMGRIDFSEDLSAPRASVENVYEQILKDLEDSYTLLEKSNGIFADRYAAQALRARVYLQQGNYAAARDAANDVIENSGHSLVTTYSEAFNNDADSVESLFAFQVTNQTGENDLVLFYASQGNGGRGGDITINDTYLNLFMSQNDDRATFFDPNSDDRLTAKYTNQFGNIEVFRLAEMYLIRAEGNLIENTAVGNTTIEDINIIRERAKAEPLTGMITQETILLERQRELAFEGFLLHDIRRTGNMVGDLASNAPTLVLPIPQNELDTNDQIEQNPGYTSN